MGKLHDVPIHARIGQEQRELLETLASARGATVSETLRDGLNSSPFFAGAIGRFLVAIAAQEGIPPRRIVERAALWVLAERQAELRSGRPASRLPSVFTHDAPAEEVWETMVAAHLQAKQETAP